MKCFTRFTAAVVSVVVVACQGKATTQPGDSQQHADPAVVLAAPRVSAPIAALQAAMDPAVSPCDDFYQYACGGWLATHEIPADRSSTGRVAGLDDDIHEALRELLAAAAERPGDDPRKQKIGDFFAACLDQAAIDAAGVTPLRPALEQIARVKDLQTAYEAAARLRFLGVEAFMIAEMDADYKAPTTNLLGLRQGGLGLPDRAFYLNHDEASRTLLADYTRHIAAMLTLIGDRKEDAAARAREVVALETVLARASLPLDQLREIEQTYHKTAIAAMHTLTPRIDWRGVLAAAGNAEVQQVNVATPAFFRESSAQLGALKAETLRAYLRWQLIRATAEHLSAPIEAQSFQWTAVLTGQRTLAPRWRRCVDRTVAALPEMVGPYYVERAFGGDSKPVALAMIVAIERALERGLDAVAWMDEATRAQALAKIAAIRNKIGFPDRWREDPAIVIDRRDYFASLSSARKEEAARQLRKADRPVDPDEWLVPTMVLNASANPLVPDMTFPAAILQPPLFSVDQPMALNFGSIGAIMGHEITHHFDDQGRKFDAKGALAGWWTEAAQGGFEAAARCVVEQYDAYEVRPGLHVKGQQTLGENLADLGGLKYAYAAHEQWAATAANEPSPVSGLTQEQLFFVAYAQLYCGKETPESERVGVLGDVHAPRKFRVLGPLSNSPKFWAAFACAEGTPMRPARACGVW